MKNCRGQIAILFLLMVPLLMLLLGMLADVALVVVTKGRMQATADRAVLAASRQLAKTMNHLAEQNWEIQHNYLEQEAEFRADQQRSEASGKQRLSARRAKINELRQAMDQQVAAGYREACEAALRVVEDETPWAELVPLYGRARVTGSGDGAKCDNQARLFDFYDDAVKANQFGRLDFTFPQDGNGWPDPGKVGRDGGELLRYRTKAAGPNQQVAFGLRLKSPLPEGTLGNLLNASGSFGAELDDFYIQAAAASQPYGGSIEEVAFLEADELEEARAIAEAEGLFYDASLVPLSLLQDRRAGYQGLNYYEPGEGWVMDVEKYGH